MSANWVYPKIDYSVVLYGSIPRGLGQLTSLFGPIIRSYRKHIFSNKLLGTDGKNEAAFWATNQARD